MNADIDRNAPIFAPIKIGQVIFRNRIFRSSISGRIDNYNGSGTPARVRFEESSQPAELEPLSRLMSRFGLIHEFSQTTRQSIKTPGFPFWTEVGKRVHSHNCKYVLQLSMSGRQQDIGGIENFRDILSLKRRAPPTFRGNESISHPHESADGRANPGRVRATKGLRPGRPLSRGIVGGNGKDGRNDRVSGETIFRW
jgi:2,4-dienoyl-CoA reductase-like NADH-dependent reductase (Old Yellow Enzyme family)